jgi:hypothetical protein
MPTKLTRERLKKIVLEERRAVTRALITEGGCGCGGCATCRSNLSSMSGYAPHDEPEEIDSLVISYGDDGLPDPKHYMDHATAGAMTQSYPYERDTDGDIVHGHEYGQSYMAKQHLHTIMKMAQQLDSMISGDEELEDWCESKLSVAASMMRSVSEFVSYHKAAAHPTAESHPADYGMRSLMRVLDEE